MKKKMIIQWRVFFYDTILIAVWTADFILLIAVALASYAIIYKTLNASIAFTIVSIFDILKMNLTAISELIIFYFNAQINVKKIEKYLNSIEKKQQNKADQTIFFQQTIIAWFVEKKKANANWSNLRNLDLNFSNNELSVICEKTKSKKNLLLASILKKADIVNEIVQMPRNLSSKNVSISKQTQAIDIWKNFLLLSHKFHELKML